ncbi:MAG TPA: hypothetical protein VF384_18900 [Planctomycetota bacterium]
MSPRILSLLALSCSLAAQGAEIYSNGPFVTHPTGGFGGSPASVVQAQAPPLGTGATLYGHGSQAWVVPSRYLADDFAVNGTWTINAIEVFAYTFGATAPTGTGVFLEIYGGGPPGVGTPVAGSPGILNNLATTAGYTVANTMTGVRRSLDTAPLENLRIIQSMKVTLATPLTLTSGVYWLQFGFASGLDFTPPLTTPFVKQTGNGLGLDPAVSPTWVPVPNGPPPSNQGWPFKLYGTSTSQPGAITNLGGGCDTATFKVEGSPAVGGYVRATLGNLNPVFVPVIILGFSDPSAPLFVCSCTSHATFDILTIGSVFAFEAPMDPSLTGFQFFLQGGQIDLVPVGGAPCNLGLQFGLTDAFSWRAY